MRLAIANVYLLTVYGSDAQKRLRRANDLVVQDVRLPLRWTTDVATPQMSSGVQLSVPLRLPSPRRTT